MLFEMMIKKRKEKKSEDNTKQLTAAAAATPSKVLKILLHCFQLTDVLRCEHLILRWVVECMHKRLPHRFRGVENLGHHLRGHRVQHVRRQRLGGDIDPVVNAERLGQKAVATQFLQRVCERVGEW